MEKKNHHSIIAKLPLVILTSMLTLTGYWANAQAVFVAFDAVGSLCENTEVTFNNSSTPNGGTISNYEWDFGDGTTQSGTGAANENPTHTYTAAGTFTVRLTVTKSSGESSFLEKDVTILATPDVSINLTSNGCLSAQQTFTSTITFPEGNVSSISWDYGDGTTSTGANGAKTFASSGVKTITLTVEGLDTTDPANTTTCTTVVTEGITIFEEPNVAFSVEDDCDGSVFNFINQSSITNGNLTYNWDFDGKATSSTLINPTPTFSGAETIDVTLTATSTISSCAQSLTLPVTIFENPVADFTVANVCFGEPVVLTNTSTGTNLTDFSWDLDDGSSSTGFSPSHTYENPGTYFVELTVTTGSGCSDVISKRLDVFEKPTPNFLADNQCDQQAVVFNNLTNESNGPLTYAWDFGDGNTSTDRSPNYTYATPGDYTVSLTATTATNCSETLTKALTIWSLPEPDFDVPNVCDGEASLFENRSTSASGTISNYLWNFGDLTSSTQENPTKQYLNAEVYTVSLTTTTTNNCSQTVTGQAVVSDLPVANFEVDNVCFGTPIQLRNLSTIAQPIALSYVWTFGDGNTSVATNPSHLYSAPGTYEITLTTASGVSCVGTFARSVTVHATPQVDAGADTTISRGGSVQLEATGGANYQWQPLAGLSDSDIANPVARPFETTDYTVTVTDTFGCTNRDTVRVALAEDFRVTPYNVFTPDGNGRNDAWVIQNAEAFDQVQVRVYDRFGVLVFADDDYQNNWQGARGTDILPDGTYYYLVSFPGTDVKYNGSLTIIRND